MSIDIKVRLDEATNVKLLEYCAKHSLTKAEAVRKGLLELLANEK